jgi:transposase
MRLHAENPELTDEELTDLAMRTGTRLKADEPRYTHTCYKCGDDYVVDQRTQDWIESLGGRIPKCGACYL